MIELAPPLRRATPDDAEALARLVDLAGEGMPSYFWAQFAEPGETPLQVGMRRARREEGGFSYRNAVVLDVAGRVAATLIGYRLDDPYDTGDLGELPPEVRPLVELESLAPGSWYVNVLAAVPEHRGRGFGTRLLAVAEDLAVASGAPALSIIVAEQNRGAHRLYARGGYGYVARRPVVAFPGMAHGGDWLLLVKDAPRASD